MNTTSQFFEGLHQEQIDMGRLEALGKKYDPKRTFVTAFTPRSGSSYLCERLASMMCFGRPDEYLNSEFMPGIIKNIPAESPEQYLRNVFRATGTPNGVAGLKASWFQFQDFIALIRFQELFAGVKFIYLARRDTAAQAVSLYLATESNVFHTNVIHDPAELNKLDGMTYSFAEIQKWYQHILVQEQGWREFFKANQISPLCITYEEVVADVAMVVGRIADYLDVHLQSGKLSNISPVFKKIGNQRNEEWAARFKSELAKGAER